MSELERKAIEMGVIAEEYLKQLLKRNAKLKLAKRHLDPEEVLKFVHGNNCSTISNPENAVLELGQGRKNSRTEGFRYE